VFQGLTYWRNRYRENLKKLYDERELLQVFNLCLEHSGMDRIQLLTSQESAMPASVEEKLEQWLLALKTGRPVQYVLGFCYFYDNRIKLNESVLIPRPETEELVEWIKSLHAEGCGKKALDVATGSGCIALSLGAHYKTWSIFATDLSEAALEIAEENRMLLGLENVHFQMHNALEGKGTLPGDFDLIVSNPPYIVRSEQEQMPLRVTNFEPHMALFVEDDDALLFYKAIARMGREMLKPGGELFFEIHENRGAELIALLNNFEYKEIECRKDLQNKDRMIRAVC